MEKKGLGSTVLGWFVEREGDSRRESPDDIIAKMANDPPPNLPPEVTLKGDIPRAENGKVDFPAVFSAAGIDTDEQTRIDKARNLLKTLPAETPKETKRQIVISSLAAFGIPVDQIIEAGAQEIQALEAYIRVGQSDTQTKLVEMQKRIEEMNTEIARCKSLMETQVSSQQSLTEACNQFKLGVQEVLEFFGQEAIARVVKESSKLHEANPNGGK